MPKTIATAPPLLFSVLQRLGRMSAYAQGKGFGVATIRQEVKFVQLALGLPAKLAMDVGGNIGDYTAELRRTTPDLEIHTFEPSATNIERLQERFGRDPNITLVPCAISNTTGTGKLFSDRPGSGLASLAPRRLAHFDIDFSCNETVSTLRFEEYWNGRLARRTLDLLKIDIEGHELAALVGAGNALQATRVIQFEFGGCNIDTRTYFQDFWYFFADNGFAIYRMTPFGLQRIDRYSESDEFFSTTNYIAVNRHEC
jgi:FkbM family methyltransferase